jgi:hypothetical protein
MYTRSTREKNEFINRTENSIVIIFGRLPLILNEDRFNNFEYGFYEGGMNLIFYKMTKIL